jgi:phosphate-selective porin OprO and OprP
MTFFCDLNAIVWHAAFACLGVSSTAIIYPASLKAQEVKQPTPENRDLDNLQKQIDELKLKVEDLEGDVETSPSMQTTTETSNDYVVAWNPLPSIASKDGQFSFATNGRMIYDYSVINYKDANGNVRIGEKVNGTELRALEFGVRGTIFKNMGYRVVGRFQDKAEIKMAYVDYDFGSFSVVMGSTRTYTALEKSTPPPDISFAERFSFVNAINADRRVGVGVTTGGSNWTASAGYFFEDLLTTNSSDDDNNLASTRFTYSPSLENGLAFHFGTSYFYRSRNGNAFDVKYSARPFAHQGGLKPLRSQELNITSEQFLGFEFVSTYKSFGVQSEYGFMRNKLSPLELLSQNDPIYNGGYFEISYFPTGGNRYINAKGGRLNNVDVKSPVHEKGIGEIKIATRFDMADFTHETFGTKQNSYIFGVDWYLNNYLRMQGNYAHTLVNNSLGIRTDKVDTFNFRVLVDW